MKKKRFATMMAMLLIAMLPVAICAYADAIIESGGNVNMNDNDGVDSLMRAAIDNSADVVRELLVVGVDVNARNHWREATATTIPTTFRRQRMR